MTVFVKDPGSTNLDYLINWSTYLASGEAINASTWAAASTSITINSMSRTTNTATVWLNGGKVGDVYRLTNKIGTDQNRRDERHIVVRVEDR